MGAARIDTFHVREANLVKSCFRQYSAYCVLRLATLRPCSDSPEEGNEGEGKKREERLGEGCSGGPDFLLKYDKFVMSCLF